MLMLKKFLFLPALCILSCYDGFAQSGQEREDFWISANMDAAMYTYSGVSWGGSLSLGYGDGTSIGLKASWFYICEGVNTLELCFLFRFYFFGSQANSGPFVQFAGGPALFFPKDIGISLPAKLGMISAGLDIGWRFLIGKLFFIEPSVRAGYPYIAGGGISAGIRF